MSCSHRTNYGKGYPEEKARLFLQFLKYHVRFAKKEFFDNFDLEIQIVNNEKDNPMGIIELVKQHVIEEAKEEGKEEGLKLGIEKGIEQGIEKGMTKGELAKARKVTKRIIEKYPAWSDQEVADLVEMPLSFVKKLRREMQKKGA